MADILHEFPINAPVARVFEGITTPAGLDQWWTQFSSGEPGPGAEYALGFGPEYDWDARVTRYVPNEEFELELVEAMDEWLGTRVGFRLTEAGDHTQVSFWHSGWKEATPHFRTSSYCWAMYLRILRCYLETGETVPYEERLDA
ncbi:MAG: SRPBCC domain-containing protein [Vicinamibacteria bacterium]|nr:SRPBCC domain-containing protein [Vicinamibacteria bacterium]